ncbi:hypothetical protein LJB42_000953 [Komagataella kurtzmanii]|nr:hypothetical protein LJB42_000953 [Komagataella kurtzmanii]
MSQLIQLVFAILWFQRIVYGIDIPEYSYYTNPDFDCPECVLITTASSLQGTINTSTDIPTVDDTTTTTEVPTTDETTTTTVEPPTDETTTTTVVPPTPDPTTPTSVISTPDPTTPDPEPTDHEEPQVPTTEDTPPIPPITTTTELVIPSEPSSEETFVETTIGPPDVTTIETPVTTSTPTVEESVVTLTSELVTTLPSLTTTIYSPVISTILTTFQPEPIVSSRIYEDRFTQTIVTFVSSAALVIRGTVTEAWSLSCTQTLVPHEITTWKTVSEPINTVQYTVVLSSSPVSHLNYTTWTTFYKVKTRTNYAIYGENQVETLTEYQDRCVTQYDYYTEVNTYLLWASSTTRTGYSTIVDRNTVLTTLYPEVVTNTLLVTDYVPVAVPIPNVSTITAEAPSTIYNTVYVTEFQTFTVTVTSPTVFRTSTITETLEAQVAIFTQSEPEVQVFTQGEPEVQEKNIAPKISRPSYIIPLLLLLFV